MARARNIKPGFFTNDKLVDLPFEVRLLFIGLWTIADKEGRLEDRPKKIKFELFPGDNVDCDAALSMLASAGFLERYQVGGIDYIQVLNWKKHQNPHVKEVDSVIPTNPARVLAIPTRKPEQPAPAPEKPTTKPGHRTQAPESPRQAPENPEGAGLIPDSPSLIPDSDSLRSSGGDPLAVRPDKFAKPTLEQVREYCNERGNSVDAERWFNHYTSNGWKVGKNSMKDWKAAVRNWETNSNGSTKTSQRVDNSAVARVERAYAKQLRRSDEQRIIEGERVG